MLSRAIFQNQDHNQAVRYKGVANDVTNVNQLLSARLSPTLSVPLANNGIHNNMQVETLTVKWPMFQDPTTFVSDAALKNAIALYKARTKQVNTAYKMLYAYTNALKTERKQRNPRTPTIYTHYQAIMGKYWALKFPGSNHKFYNSHHQHIQNAWQYWKSDPQFVDTLTASHLQALKATSRQEKTAILEAFIDNNSHLLKRPYETIELDASNRIVVKCTFHSRLSKY